MAFEYSPANLLAFIALLVAKWKPAKEAYEKTATALAPMLALPEGVAPPLLRHNAFNQDVPWYPTGHYEPEKHHDGEGCVYMHLYMARFHSSLDFLRFTHWFNALQRLQLNFSIQLKFTSDSNWEAVYRDFSMEQFVQLNHDVGNPEFVDQFSKYEAYIAFINMIVLGARINLADFGMDANTL